MHRRMVTVALLTLAACGGGEGKQAVPDTTPTTAATTSTTRPTFIAAARWDFRLTGRGGNNAAGSVELGKLARFDEPAVLPSGRTASTITCNHDPSRDLLVPVRVQLTNTTSGFSQSLGLTVSVLDAQEGGPLGSSVQLDADVVFDRPTCRRANPANQSTTNQGDGVGFTKPGVPPNGTTELEFFLILHGLRSPAQPMGDLRRVAFLGLWLEGNPAPDNPQNVTSLDGPEPKEGCHLTNPVLAKRPVLSLSAVAGVGCS